jgi:hypothetical protein
MKRQRRREDGAVRGVIFYKLENGVVTQTPEQYFQEKVIYESKVGHAVVTTSFVNMPREHDCQEKPLCFETLINAQTTTLDCEVYRCYSVKDAKKTHDNAVSSIKKILPFPDPTSSRQQSPF